MIFERILPGKCVRGGRNCFVVGSPGWLFHLRGRSLMPRLVGVSLYGRQAALLEPGWGEAPPSFRFETSFAPRGEALCGPQEI